jgi:transcription elongation factor Elf1
LEKRKNKKNQPVPYAKCTECGDYKEVSKKYINKTTEEMVTICYDCGKQRYIESLMVVSAIDGFDDL